ncbi:MAG: hypothetical protein KKB31_07510 [Nanoarchaeota archaeon]|nr:hypothetical protein [Nanoarchaeota archaeon]
MSVIDDAVQIVTNEAGMTSAKDKALAKAYFYETLEDMNRQFHSGILRTEASISIASSAAHTLTLPDDVEKIIDFGEYNSTEDRLKPVWTAKTQSWFQKVHSGFATLTSSASGSERIYFFVTDNAQGAKRVRIFPAASSAITARLIYWARLTEDNVHRMHNTGIIHDGMRWRLVKWFGGKDVPASWQEAKERYQVGILDLKSKKMSVKSAITVGQAPITRRRNAILRSLQ